MISLELEFQLIAQLRDTAITSLSSLSPRPHPTAERLAKHILLQCQTSKRISAMDDNGVVTEARSLLNKRLKLVQFYCKPNPTQLFCAKMRGIAYRKFTHLGHYNFLLQELDDFVTGLLAESLKPYRQCNSSPIRTRLEIAEWLTWADLWVRRSVQGSQMVLLRATTYSNTRRYQDVVTDFSDIELEDCVPEREALAVEVVIGEFTQYLKDYDKDRKSYPIPMTQFLNYTLHGRTGRYRVTLSHETGLSLRTLYYTQQRFKYYLDRFRFQDRWKDVHDWLGISLDRNLGLLPSQWDSFLARLTAAQLRILHLYQQGMDESGVVAACGRESRKQWRNALILAWEIRQGKLASK